MPISNKAIEQLAREWVKEATRLRGLALCACPCGLPIKPRAYRQGHDAKLRAHYARIIRAALGDEPN
jgi:hypothetical protein